MEVIKPIKVNIDALAEKVFQESINILGGLRRLIEYRNLTWLPALAEASYVVVLKNEALKTYSKIAKELGITEQTVKNIANADEEKVKSFLENPEERPKEHIAGGIAKLAYHRLKEEGRLEEVSLGRDEAEALAMLWAYHVLSSIKGLDFPANKEELMERLRGLQIKNRMAEEILEEIEYPVKNPAELLKKIREKL